MLTGLHPVETSFAGLFNPAPAVDPTGREPEFPERKHPVAWRLVAAMGRVTITGTCMRSTLICFNPGLGNLALGRRRRVCSCIGGPGTRLYALGLDVRIISRTTGLTTKSTMSQNGKGPALHSTKSVVQCMLQVRNGFLLLPPGGAQRGFGEKRR